MDGFRQHVSICDPQPSAEDLQDWRTIVDGIAANMMKLNSPQALFEVCNDLERIVETRAAGSGRLGSCVASAVTAVEAEGTRGENGLRSCLCAMLAVRDVLATEGGPKRAAIAVAVWSALSFGAQLSESRLEVLRLELLESARRGSLAMAGRVRQRSEERVDQTGGPGRAALKTELAKTVKALQRNAALDCEDIALLRWLLADRAVGLGLAFADITRPASATVAMAMELGQLLTRFPTAGHFALGEHFVRDASSMDVRELVDAVGSDRARLAALCSARCATDRWPDVFPLMNALAGRSVKGSGAGTKRSLREWWERALLESAATVIVSERGWSRDKWA